MVSRTPPPALAGLVDSAVAYDIATGARDVHLGLPSSSATVILSLAEPITVRWLDDASRSWSSYRWLIGGFHLRPALVRAGHRQAGIQLGLTPVGVRALFGFPISALTATLVGAAEVGRPDLDRLADRVVATSGWDRRLDRVLQHFVGLVDHDQCHRAPLVTRQAWEVFAAGETSVTAAAARVGIGRRRLSTLTQAEFGVAPKQLARLHRFDRARRFVAAGDPLALVAARAGYSDQAHLSHEWRELAGRSPSVSVSAPFFDPAELD